MMYIRTKDGVYEVVTAERGSDNKLLYIISTSKTENTTDWVHEAGVIKQADTIEELCDLYIDEETQTIFHKHNGYVINWKTNMVYSLKALSESYYSVKGAIYTSKGLIYVAKMNDKGEIELI